MKHSTKPADWLLLLSGQGSAYFNMAMDEALLEAAPATGIAVLRFYAWSEPAASFGYFQRYADVERATLLRPLVRRPTGGGIVPHDADWTYSVVFPTSHEWYSFKAEHSYRQIHELLRSAFSMIGIATELAVSRESVGEGKCFAGHEKCDLLWHGRKIAGAAQRRTQSGLLIQGSVQPPTVIPRREDWHLALCEVVQTEFAGHGHPFHDELDLKERALSMAREKYSTAAYNRRR